MRKKREARSALRVMAYSIAARARDVPEMWRAEVVGKTVVLTLVPRKEEEGPLRFSTGTVYLTSPQVRMQRFLATAKTDVLAMEAAIQALTATRRRRRFRARVPWHIVGPIVVGIAFGIALALATK